MRRWVYFLVGVLFDALVRSGVASATSIRSATFVVPVRGVPDLDLATDVSGQVARLQRLLPLHEVRVGREHECHLVRALLDHHRLGRRVEAVEVARGPGLRGLRRCGVGRGGDGKNSQSGEQQISGAW